MVEWDEAKRAANILKHDVDFSIVDGFDWNAADISEDIRRDYGEQRWIAMVPFEERLYVVVYVLRGDEMRVISARKANVREVRTYEAKMDSSH